MNQCAVGQPEKRTASGKDGGDLFVLRFGPVLSAVFKPLTK